MEISWNLQKVSKFSALGVVTLWNRPQKHPKTVNFLSFFTFSFDFREKFCFIDPHYFSPTINFVPNNYPQKIKGNCCFRKKVIFAGKLVTQNSNWVNIFLVQFFASVPPSGSVKTFTRVGGHKNFKKLTNKSKNRNFYHFDPPNLAKKSMKEWFNQKVH